MTRIEARNKIIFALDVNALDEIDRFAGLLSGRVGMFKIGKELFTACGREAVATVQRHGGGVRPPADEVSRARLHRRSGFSQHRGDR